MNNLLKLDKKYLWHPFTQAREWEIDLSPSLMITRGRGIYLYDSRGKKYIDGTSSLWANIHGHRCRAIDASIRAQLNKVAHTTFLGLTHQPGILFARELVKISPAGLNRVFYSDNGSTAVEVALKMAFQYRAQSGKPGHPVKLEFLALKNSYHGDTLGAVSVGGTDLFHKLFKPLLFKTRFAMSPHCLRCPHNKSRRLRDLPREVLAYRYNGETPKPGDKRPRTDCRWECLKEVEAILKKHGKNIAGAIVEPVVQGAGGMIVMPPGYLKGFELLCKKYEILLILDEVLTGFGRTGKIFACAHENVKPDLLCLSKGITGGYMPLAATLASEKIFRAFLGEYEDYKTFFHGHTYTANPLACSAGRASLKLARAKAFLTGIKKLEKLFTGLLSEILPLPFVGHIRQAGLIAGIEIVKDKNTLEHFPPSLRIGKRICDEARKSGIILRPLGDVLVLIPPLSIKERELAALVGNLKVSMGRISYEY